MSSIQTSTGHTGVRPLTPLVRFDGGCPMCRREIAHYRRLEGSRRLAWVDIAQTPDIEQQVGVSHAAAMAHFHVRDAAGEWHVGAHGFVELWGCLLYTSDAADEYNPV